MGRLIYHRKKDSGTTYVYEVVEEHWDKQLKQMCSKQAYIGNHDPDIGELIESKRTKSVPSCAVTVSTSVVGPMLILDKIRKIFSQASAGRNGIADPNSIHREI